jgi:hypothetical protein
MELSQRLVPGRRLIRRLQSRSSPTQVSATQIWSGVRRSHRTVRAACSGLRERQRSVHVALCGAKISPRHTLNRRCFALCIVRCVGHEGSVAQFVASFYPTGGEPGFIARSFFQQRTDPLGRQSAVHRIHTRSGSMCDQLDLRCKNDRRRRNAPVINRISTVGPLVWCTGRWGLVDTVKATALRDDHTSAGVRRI